MKLKPGFETLKPGFETLEPGFETPKPGFETPKSGLETLKPGFESLKPSFEILKPNPLTLGWFVNAGAQTYFVVQNQHMALEPKNASSCIKFNKNQYTFGAVSKCRFRSLELIRFRQIQAKLTRS